MFFALHTKNIPSRGFNGIKEMLCLVHKPGQAPLGCFIHRTPNSLTFTKRESRSETKLRTRNKHRSPASPIELQKNNEREVKQFHTEKGPV